MFWMDASTASAVTGVTGVTGAAASAGAKFVWSPTALAAAITAIGALGTAAFGLVDATKLFWGGVSNSGFVFITRLLKELAPDEKGVLHNSSITRAAISDTLKANWLNGVPESDLKSTAKSLIKLRLNATTAAHLAKVTGVDSTSLEVVATSLAAGAALLPEQMNTYGRFDLLLSTMIDRAYQRADQRYRNSAKVLALFMALALAEIAAWSLHSATGYDGSIYIQGLVAGLLATPLAPIAKDVATGLNSAAKAVQAVKGQ